MGSERAQNDRETVHTRSPATGAPSSAPVDVFGHGRYEVVRLVGEGGQKRVYLARDTRLGRDVVIAALRRNQFDEQAFARLQREARALARLGDHPHIVTVFDIGEDYGQPYLVTQFVDGGSVDALRQAAPERRLGVDRVLQIGREVCAALRYAHSRGIVHRDVKPGNVWLTADGVVKLGDFGLAIGLDLSRVTAEEGLLGTVPYMAPEQIMGRDADPRSDLYSLGVMLYELTTGRRPFAGDSIGAIISQHLHDAPVAPSWHAPDIPRSFEALILALLAKQPEERPASAATVEEALATISASDARTATDRHQRPLERLAGGIFVGRTAELQQLRAGLDAALHGRGNFCLITGEPGSGKTAIVEQLVTYARVRGLEVIRAHCYEGEGAPAYWPWVQLLRDYSEGRSPGELAAAFGRGATVIVQLDPELQSRLPDLPPPAVLEPDQARFRLFDSITSFLKTAAADRPLVVFIDDLQWADVPSLLLLDFLARELSSARLLVLATYREAQLPRQHPLSQLLGTVAAEGVGRRILLAGLTEADVARFIEMTIGVTPPPRAVRAVYDQTEGNPFFVKEVVRLLVESGQLDRFGEAGSRDVRLPQGVREVVTRRLANLPDACHRVLTTASVVGREFDIDCVERLCEVNGDALVELLERAEAALLVMPVDDGGGRYRFSHALIRETLYDGLSPARRTRMHRRVGEVLEALGRDTGHAQLAQLAHHFYRAIPLTPPAKAIRYATRAAEQADALLAYEEAAHQYRLSLSALDLAEHEDQRRRCELLLALGEVQSKAGLSEDAKETFRRAAVLSREVDADLFARAALGIGAATAARTAFGTVVHDEIALLREALDRTDEADSAVRARLLSQLSLASLHLPDTRVALSERAVETARRVGDPGAILAALYSHCVALAGSPRTHDRLGFATELVTVAQATGDKEMALRGRYRRFRELLELGDVAGAELEINLYAALADELRQPRHLWYVPFGRAVLAGLRGEFAESDRLTEEAKTIGGRTQDPNLPLFCVIQRYTNAWLQGHFDIVEPMLTQLIARHPLIQGWRVQRTRLLCFMSRLDEARGGFEELAARDFADILPDSAFLTSLCALSQACAFLGDRRRADILYARLEPYAERNAVSGHTGVGSGAVSHYLALVASTLDRSDEAERLFEHAIAFNSRMGARPRLAYAQCDYARMLMARRAAGDERRAAGLLLDALALGRDLGLKWVVGSARDQLDGLAPSAPPS